MKRLLVYITFLLVFASCAKDGYYVHKPSEGEAGTPVVFSCRVESMDSEMSKSEYIAASFDDEKIFIILDEDSKKYDLLKEDINNAFPCSKIIFSKNPKETKKAYIVFANSADFLKAQLIKSRFREFSRCNNFSIQKYTNKNCFAKI